ELSQNEKTGNGKQSSYGDPPRWYASPEWILIFITGITAGFICWQSYETRRSVEASKSKDRARIHIEIEPLKRQPVVVGQPPETYITYTIRCYCPTNAFDVSGFAGAWIGDHTRLKRKLRPPIKLPFTIMPTDTAFMQHVIIIPKQMSAEDFEDVRIGKQFVQFFGVINYTDVFGKKRQTKWRRLWKPHMELHDYGVWENVGWWKDNRQT
ncbi:MAG: hypothetical protein KGL75_12435, partial [Acidobacteriota bacterium]|nr:hypothetical protein [Acidobacteriota bacterium]